MENISDKKIYKGKNTPEKNFTKIKTEITLFTDD